MFASVIIPNWNGAKFLSVCLNALRQQTWRDFEVIVVDNASTDGSVDLIEQSFPDVRLVKLFENRFFSGAVNIGIEVAKGDLIILLNNDTEAEPSWLEALVGALDRHPEAGFAASKLLLFDDRSRLHSAGDFLRVDGTPGNRGVWELDDSRFDVEEYVFSACGAAGAYRRSLFDKIGGFDEAFYGYCEDVDVAFRAQLAGFRCIFVPTARVYHRLSATGGGPLASYLCGRNFVYLLVKDMPGDLIRRHWRSILRAQLRYASESVRHWREPAARARLRGQIVGLLTLPKMLGKRREVRRLQRITSSELEAMLVGGQPPAQSRSAS